MDEQNTLTYPIAASIGRDDAASSLYTMVELGLISAATWATATGEVPQAVPQGRGVIL